MPAHVTKTVGETFAGLRRGRPGEPLAFGAILAVIVLLSSALAARWSLSVDEWRVMTDEMGYVKVAISISHSLLPFPDVRGQSIQNYGVLYPTLLAPLVGVLDMPTAFRVAHGMGAVLMASAAVPTYLLTRYVSRSRSVALAAAASMAFAPWLVFSMSLVTEVVAYPMFLWAVLAMVIAISSPSHKRDLVAIGAVALAFLTRTQFVFLIVLLPAAILVHEVGYRLSSSRPGVWHREALAGLRAAVTQHVVVSATVVLAAVVALVGNLGVSSLGSYQAAVSGTKLFPSGFGASAFEHLNEVILGVAVLPLALSLAYVVERLIAPMDRRSHAFVVLVALCVPALVVIATSFDLAHGRHVQERYLFYIVPLLVTTAACYLHEARRPALSLSLATALTAIFVLQTPFVPNGDFPAYASPMRFLWVPLEYRIDDLNNLLGLTLTNPQAIVGGLAVAAVAVVALLRAGRSQLAVVGVSAGLAVWGIALTLYVGPKVKLEHESLALQTLGAKASFGSRDWIDQALPKGASASLVPSVINARNGTPVPPGTATNLGVWWQAEFWNKTVGQAYVYDGASDYTPYRTQAMVLLPRSGVLRESGLESRYLVVARSNVRFAPEGRVVARDPDLLVYRARQPYRALWATRGISDDGRFRHSPILRVYGRQPSGDRRYEVSLSLFGATGRTAISVDKAGAVSRRSLRGGGTLHTSICVPRGQARAVRLGGRGLTNARLIGVKVAPTRVC